MEYRTLTGTGAKVSRVCLGTMTLGAQVDEAESIRLVHRALDLGVNFIDVADAYNKGLTETIVGKALEGKREGVVLVSKVRWLVGAHEFKDQGLSRWHILKGVEASLRRLRTDCLDVLLYHGADYSTPYEESLAAGDKLVRDGKVMYYGVCNEAAWQVCHQVNLARQRNLTPPTVTQVPYNLITRGIEPELLPFVREYKVGLMVYNPLAGGLLTGKHDPARAPAEGTRFQVRQDYYNRYWRDTNFSAVADLMSIAKEAGKTPVQLALQWLLAQPAVDAVILGATSVEQLEENIASAEGKLDEETLKACDRVWQRIRGESFQYNR